MRIGTASVGCLLFSASFTEAFQIPLQSTTQTPTRKWIHCVGEYGLGKVAFAKTKKMAKWSHFRMAEGDDVSSSVEDSGGPLSKGIDSVQWLPTCHGARNNPVTDMREGAIKLPLFPLGGIVYTPNSEHTLNIFEPRYRQMYNDILMNGTKRFVVSMAHPTERGRFAEIGVLFELEDLKEVSEQTNDQVKFVCRHRVTGRVKMHRVLNPSVWESRKTYLQVEGTLMDVDNAGAAPQRKTTEDDYDEETGLEIPSKEDSNKFYEPAAPQKEQALKDSFTSLVNMQHELQEDVRFTKASAQTLAVSPGDTDEGLWSTIKLWQSYSEQRLVARQNELQREFQEKLLAYLTKEKGVKKEELPSSIGFNDLSPDLQKEVQALQKRMTVELEPLVLESTLSMQKILEAQDHAARTDLMRFFIDAERKRLATRKRLQDMFQGALNDESLGDDNTIPPEERLLEEKAPSSSSSSLPTLPDDDNAPSGLTGSLFTDEEDAFQ